MEPVEHVQQDLRYRSSVQAEEVWQPSVRQTPFTFRLPIKLVCERDFNSVVHPRVVSSDTNNSQQLGLLVHFYFASFQRWLDGCSWNAYKVCTKLTKNSSFLKHQVFMLPSSLMEAILDWHFPNQQLLQCGEALPLGLTYLWLFNLSDCSFVLLRTWEEIPH